MLVSALQTCLSSGELIETLWNVNDKVRAILGLDKTELIETLWNVNKNTMELKEIESMN